LNKIDSAYLFASKSFNYESDIRTQKECYRILANSEYLRANMTEMSAYMNKYVIAGDSIRKIESQTKGSYIESKHYAELKYVKTRKVLWYSLGLIVLIVVLSYIVYTQLHNRNKREKTQLLDTHLLKEASIRKNVVSQYSESLHQKIEKRKKEQEIERKKANYAEKVLLDRKIYDELLHLNNPELFFREMDSVLNNLTTKLMTRYPSVTVKEISWCCLSLLEIPTSDIYVLLDYSVDGLKSMRKRLAQKIGLSGVSGLKNFLDKLISE